VPTTTFDRAAILRAVDETARRLVDLVTAAPDPGVRVPNTPQWTVAEAFAHIATVAPRYAQGARHEGEWAERAGDLADLNARQIAALPTTDVSSLAERLTVDIAALADLIAGFGDEQPVFRFHGGEKISADVSLGVLLGELVVHGYDIAQALHRPWPIDPAHVQLILRGISPILPGWLDPERARGHTGRYEVRLRGQGVHRFDFDRGRLTMNPPGRFRPDVVISADPVTFLLVMYKRTRQWPGILTGRLVARGRRPWLALGFSGVFHQP
jgi:uncharacterized protein (TIGR03083 family)